MGNPYHSRPPSSFWKRSVAALDPDSVDPILKAPFKLARHENIATAGSCFAQRLAQAFVSSGCNYLLTEPRPLTAGAEDQSFGQFSARFGNVYTAAQLNQLFDRAFGLFEPSEPYWTRTDGRYVDQFRPRIQDGAFRSPETLLADREAHLGAVRDMFERCDVFLFTLGLTECWRSKVDGAIVPLPPGLAGDSAHPQDYVAADASVVEIADTLVSVIDKMRNVRPALRVVLSVSPVPIVATHRDEHVLVANTLTKSKLRVATEMAVCARPDVAYFPSYELVVGAHQRSRFFAENLREITPEGIAYVLSFFTLHYVSDEPALRASRSRIRGDDESGFDHAAAFKDVGRVVCDDEDLIETR